jgi:murein tripeptide amidase MpaA
LRVCHVHSFASRPPPQADTIWLAYFAPFPYARHQRLVAKSAASPFCSSRSLGKSLDGRDIDQLTVGDGPLAVWVLARQHPNEPQGEFWMEGFLGRLLDPDDPVAAGLRAAATFRVVPCVNPDGGARGHLRTNACGANLNREWQPTGAYLAPTLARSPEVFHVLGAMDQSGCDCFLDVHGDEELPYNFICGSQGAPGWSPRLARLLATLCSAYAEASPDFQVGFGYDNDELLGANCAIAGDQVATRFDCLSATLEMPYKDSLARGGPLPQTGWSPQRCSALGAAVLGPLAKVLPLLRAEEEEAALGLPEGGAAALPDWVQPGYMRGRARREPRPCPLCAVLPVLQPDADRSSGPPLVPAAC